MDFSMWGYVVLAVMDHTTISVGCGTRDALKAYRDRRDLLNMNEAVRDLLKQAESEPLEV